MALKRNKRGSIILPNGDRITISEQKQLRSLVSSANRKRARLISKLPNEARLRRDIFGVESDFLFRKKSASFSRFRNKTEFKHYIKALQRIVNRDFERRRVENYRRNYIKSLRKVFNSEAREVIKKIKEMSWTEFKELIDSGMLPDIAYVYYDPDNTKLASIEIAIGLRKTERSITQATIKQKKSLADLGSKNAGLRKVGPMRK